ncbi:biopolymer transporter ExbD [Paraflavitalea sp. CAU 1676]|uniref:ExbD/TolR family protein n=1 Tax=Paraflavitalea sp. CAU 1676 TaxID=3032598 RepID=UPI0023DACB2C|nr:biopolymer transporter ExbD [Paraflavitalea sp. CAU 1676]MDF2190962.1 biopolymer transporter ExbD [Paraflavitalea sp. CAU 1676]
MAEINTATTSNKPGVRRSKKLSTRVDLTPMVDLGFLLITFFIFTTTMSDPRATKLVMPDDTKPVDVDIKVPISAALTVLPLEGNKIFYYHGTLEEAMAAGNYGVTSYAVKDGIGQIIRDKQVAMDKAKPGSRKDLTLMIKPHSESNYQNVVDVLDEVQINGLKHYALMEITPEEKDIIKQKAGGL